MRVALRAPLTSLAIARAEGIPTKRRSRATLLKRIADIVTRTVPTHSIYIFGSYARGEERSASDLDIYVHFLDGKDTIAEKCVKTRMALFDFIYRQNNLSFDLVGDYDSSHACKADSLDTLANVVEREGVVIYG